jgi:DNA-binding MarR family transcriptional regulator
MVSAPPVTARGDTDSKARLRLWIRLLRATRIVEAQTRELFKQQFNVTVPRFDVMAALYRKPEGMLMSEISRFLLVSNGNVTGIVDRLVSDGFVVRSQRNGDRRTSFVRLTAAGRAAFAKMSAALEKQIAAVRRRYGAKPSKSLSWIPSQRLGGETRQCRRSSLAFPVADGSDVAVIQTGQNAESADIRPCQATGHLPRAAHAMM